MIHLNWRLTMKWILLGVLAFLLMGCQTVPKDLESSSSSSSSTKKLNFAQNAYQVPSYGRITHSRIYVPEGFDKSKKYSAVVILPSCADTGGVNAGQLESWVRLFTKNGYATILVSHLVSRGIYKKACGGIRPVGENVLVQDLYQAVSELSSKSYIKNDQIFAIGFSLGAMTIANASSVSAYDKLAPGKQKFKAAAGVYGSCTGGGYTYLKSDTNMPLLWLMGEDDTESPYGNCIGKVESLKERIEGFDFHVYPNATHCWDCSVLNGKSKVHPKTGAYIKYVYNEEVTRDSERRVLEFFKSFK